MFLHQRQYALEVLEKAGMLNSHPCRTPIDTERKIGAVVVPVSHPILYRSLAGALRVEAVYRGVANVVAEIALLRNLLCELHSPLKIATLVCFDNVGVVYLSYNPVQHQRTKHIEIDIHFFCDQVVAGHIRVLHVPSRYQVVAGLLYVLLMIFAPV
ncbi:ribonuclease H-like domain-containing protein [Tanacetum coccineum]